METLSELETRKKVTLMAEMYYIHKMSQKDIAKRMGISRPWVSKLLQRAEEMNIVRIEVDSSFSGCQDVRQKLREKYYIDNIYVIDSMNSDSFSSVGNAAANYLVSKIEPGDTIGVSWGMSLAKMINHITPMNIDNVLVVPLVGGAGSNAECLSNSIANRLAKTVGAKCELLHANAYCSDENEYRTIISNPYTKSVLEKGEKANIALVGLGDLKHSRMIEYGYVTKETEKDFENAGAVGDIALRLIDKGGEILDIDFNKQIVASHLDIVRKNAREVIAIAFGETKVEVIKAAIKGRLITTLFTDLKTAEMLL